jgi:hypothetical protein
MSQGGLTVGNDLSVNIITQFGLLKLKKGTIFNATPVVTTRNVLPIIDKLPIHLRFPQGWQGTITFARDGKEMDAYWARVEAAYFAGEVDIGSTIIQTIKEPDGSTSRWLYSKVFFSLEDPGEYRQDQEVTGRVMFYASTKEEVPFA